MGNQKLYQKFDLFGRGLNHPCTVSSWSMTTQGLIPAMKQPVSWPIKDSNCWDILPILQIWHPVTFSYFLSWRRTWEAGGFTQIRSSKQLYRGPLKDCQKMASTMSLRAGPRDATHVSTRWGIMLKNSLNQFALCIAVYEKFQFSTSSWDSPRTMSYDYFALSPNKNRNKKNSVSF